MTTAHKNEILLTALTSYQLAELAVSNGDFDQVRPMILAQNRLLDACVDLGMDFETVSVTEWAATRAAKILCAA